MARIVHSSTFSAKGPWLLASDALTELDKLFSRLCEGVESEREERIRAYVDERLRDISEAGQEQHRQIQQNAAEQLYKPRPPEVRVVLRDGRKVIGESLSELLENPELGNEVLTNLSMRAYENAFGAEYSVQLSKSGSELCVEVPPDSTLGLRFLSRVRDWAAAHGPQPWQRIWTSYYALSWIAWVIIGTLLPSTVLESAEYTAIKSRATALVEHGITANELPSGVETLLRLQLAPRSTEKVLSDTWTKRWFFVGLPICIALSIRPRVILGVGKGRSSIKRWSMWMRLVMITAPATAFATFAWPWIATRLEAFLR